MMHREIEEIMVWSKRYTDHDPQRILLGSNDIPQPLRSAVALQLQLTSKIKKKLPLFSQRECYVPERINLEQASSQATAYYKKRFVAPADNVADLTGGLAVDFFALMQVASKGVYHDLSPRCVQAANYNGAKLLPEEIHLSITYMEGDSLLQLPRLVQQEHCSLIYADPARRGEGGQRLYSLEQTMPSPLEVAGRLQQLRYGGKILIKLSPMADITEILRRLPWVSEVHIVAHHDELKEILIYGNCSAEVTSAEDCRIYALQTDMEGNAEQGWSFVWSEALSCSSEATASEPGNYLFLPHAAAMKSGAFALLGERFGVRALAHNSHLFTGERVVESFPGKCYRLLEVFPYKKKQLALLKNQYPHLSISVRNFPLRAEELKKQLGTGESDTYTLFATTDNRGNRLLLVAERCQTLL